MYDMRMCIGLKCDPMNPMEAILLGAFQQNKELFTLNITPLVVCI